MDQKVKIELEYPVRVPKKIVFTRLSTINGLNEWFADEVRSVGDNKINFTWDGQSQTARVIDQKLNQYVRFQWVEEQNSSHYFEFMLQTHELTRDTTLIVTDFVEEDEKADAIDLWNKQIGRMMRKFGTN